MRKPLALIATAGLTFGLAAAPVGADDPNIVELAVNASGGEDAGAVDGNFGDFDFLINAVVGAGLADDLTAKRQLTVFAPTDAAFMQFLGYDDPDTWEADEAEALTALTDLAEAAPETVAGIVAYHVAPGERPSEDVVPAERIRTITKDFITKDSGSTTLIDGQGNEIGLILGAIDLEASNGIVHAIDTVMMPSS